MKKTTEKESTYFFKKFRTYDVEDILAAGGTTALGKQTGYDPKKLYHLKGQTLSEEDYQKALKMLTK